MNGIRTRYRGAQPFADDPLSQRTFFGREEAAVSLTNQILANRLVVVYAKSGLGKSSLLNAGVAPRLREAGCQPLMVRVNDVQQGPLASVLQGIRAEVQRQGVEYVEGDSSSLWAFFKTVEFWRGDLLLQPVLVIDQFEELFTLHEEAARDELLEQLGHLVRGVPPPLPPGATRAYSETPPAMHIVLSLREDFLGILEDASDRIPQIMDHRFRLSPLGRAQACEAMTGPAAIEDPTLATPPFVLAPAFIDTVLDLLTAPAVAGPGAVRRAVEPFHLQLICQRVEQKVAATKGRRFEAGAPFTLADFGGEAALAGTLTDFYTHAVQSLSEAYLRPVARRLCEEFLISPEGRRLSIEEHEIRKQLGLSAKALQQLVDARLLRTDRRSDSTYYELGHDALVEPVLATRRTRGLLLGWAGIVLGAVVTLACVFVIISILTVMATTMGAPEGSEEAKTDLVGVAIVLVAVVMALLLPIRIVKAGMRARRRYGRRPGRDEAETIPTLLPLHERILDRTLVWSGTAILALFGIASPVVLFMTLWAFATGGQVPPGFQDQDSEMFAQALVQHPVQELFWLLIEITAISLFGALLRGVGKRRLNPVASRAVISSAASAHWLAKIDLEAARRRFSAVAFMAALAASYVMLHCGLLAAGEWPGWLSQALFSTDHVRSCPRVGAGDWGIEEAVLILFFVSALGLAVADWGPKVAGFMRRLRAPPAVPPSHLPGSP
ncbi:MAG TPA: hypothetical protein VGQ91_03565 [Ideonella sp.]|nr:hypothetical protein [Ideonella sp.]